MEVISIEGIEYVKANQIAKRFKYTTDYIGQLCRAGKVEAKLVGRTWYVNPESLSGHKNTRYIKSSPDEKTSHINVVIAKSEISPKRVEPVIRKNLFRTGESKSTNEARFIKHIAWQPAKYEPDTADLYPHVRDQENSQRLAIELADATKVTIDETTKPVNLMAEALPEVSLRGKVKISSFDDSFENSDENIDISDIFEEESEVVEEVSSVKEITKIKKPAWLKADKQSKAKERYSYPVEIHTDEKVFDNLPSIGKPVFTPAHISKRDNFESARGSDELTEVNDLSHPSWFWPVGLFILGGLLALAVVGIEKNIYITKTDYSTDYSLNFSWSDWSKK